MCRSPLEDFKGMRIRSLGQQGKAMAKLGAVPTSVPAPEVYTSLDRGLLDAAGFAYYAHEVLPDVRTRQLVHQRLGRRLHRLRFFDEPGRLQRAAAAVPGAVEQASSASDAGYKAQIS